MSDAILDDSDEPAIFEDRLLFSFDRLTDLASQLSQGIAGLTLGPLFVFAAGSYARGEASEHSDIDLFLGYDDLAADGSQAADAGWVGSRRTNEFRLFAQIIQAIDDLGFPALSADSKYLKTHNLSDVISAIGGERDDVDNHFTFRMLLLLEGKCITGHMYHRSAVNKIVDSYYRDYPRHASEFKPWFLLNDIIRYWKTLTLNYENRRPSPDSEDVDARRVKSFKLKFSRMTTCFATVCAIGARMTEAHPEDIQALVMMTPNERLRLATAQMPSLLPLVKEVRNRYAWFLEQTALPTEALQAKFLEDEERRRMFDAADLYGRLMFDLVNAVDDNLSSANIEYMRLLVI